MVNVQGDDDDLWFAHVLSCDTRSQTSRVHFYIENNGKYNRESRSRTAVETIHWNSIAGMRNTGYYYNLMIFLFVVYMQCVYICIYT